MYSIKSLGLNTDPWGIPQVMSKPVEETMTNSTNCFLLAE